MNPNRVSQFTLDPVSTHSITPVFNVTTNMLDFIANSPARSANLLPMEKDVKTIEVFHFRNSGLILCFFDTSVKCYLFTTAPVTNSIIVHTGDCPLLSGDLPASSHYIDIVGRILTDVEHGLWFFRFGCGTRKKFGLILNYLVWNGNNTTFTGALGNKTLSLIDQYVQVTNVNGDIIYRSRVNRLQRTLLKD